MIGIVVALKKEAEKFLLTADNVKQIKLADKDAFLGKVDDIEFILIISGIGKVSSALSTQLLIDKYSPTSILNFGTTGGMNQSVQALNYYLVDKCCQYDFDLTELDDVPLGYIQDYDTVFFNTKTDKVDFLPIRSLASADKFTNKDTDIKTINDLGCSLCDMEGAAIAQVCTSNNLPLYIVKGISDVSGSGTAPEQFMKNLQTVGENFPNVIIKVIKSIA